MVELTAEQYQELTELLSSDPKQEGSWAIVNNPGPCIYAVNSHGTIVVRLSCIDKAGRKQKPRRCQIHEFDDHYLFCNINGKDVRLHRLMAATWLDDWDESLTVNHKDGNKQNNHIDNLEMMTIHDNCVYYHTSDRIKEQRERDYAHHGKTIAGRIHITNGKESKMIHLEDGIPEGWWKGRPQSMKDKVSLAHKGLSAPNSGKVMITDGKIVKYIEPSLPVPEGWRLGGVDNIPLEHKAKMREDMQNRTFVYKNGINKRIHNDELAEYLDDGWAIGFIRKS